MKITVLSPVKHDGKDLDVGETYNLPDRAANDLVAAGAAELAGKAKASPPPETKPPVVQAVVEPAPGEEQVADEGGQQ